ncbi:hypothetical protein T492DRAFT_865238 [Pavlovales sp. CCMP2436]|nr:hypothetical protein T492DRAFT_865238 [Pavlovales sp. CCMP2436]
MRGRVGHAASRRERAPPRVGHAAPRRGRGHAGARARGARRGPVPARWKVHSVLDMRGEQEDKQYLVQWAPLGEYDPSWEPDQNLQHCQGMIIAFMARRAAA